MVQVELNIMYINIGANSGSEQLRTKKNKTLRLPVNQLRRSIFHTFMFTLLRVHRCRHM